MFGNFGWRYRKWLKITRLWPSISSPTNVNVKWTKTIGVKVQNCYVKGGRVRCHVSINSFARVLVEWLRILELTIWGLILLRVHDYCQDFRRYAVTIMFHRISGISGHKTQATNWNTSTGIHSCKTHHFFYQIIKNTKIESFTRIM